jgi:hypothetical protein
MDLYCGRDAYFPSRRTNHGEVVNANYAMRALGLPTTVRQVTTYGGPSDPFVRIRQTFRVEGDTMIIDEEVVARPYAKAITVNVSFGDGK